MQNSSIVIQPGCENSMDVKELDSGGLICAVLFYSVLGGCIPCQSTLGWYWPALLHAGLLSSALGDIFDDSAQPGRAFFSPW